MSYGALNLADIQVLEEVLELYHGRPLRFLEIGIHTGTTARGIRDYCAAHGIALDYWGIDSSAIIDAKQPFPEAVLIKGDSAEVFHLIGPDFDVVFVDGCHSRNHVILDTCNYASKVTLGGFMLYHDTSPEIQQTMREASGPPIPQFHNSVNEALDLIRWPWPGWTLWREGYEKGHAYGGTRAYRRTA